MCHLRHVVRDSIPPTVGIQQPTEGSITNSTQVTVTGAYSDGSQTTVVVNGISADSSGGTYSASVPLNVEGANTIQVVATDAAGNQSTATRIIKRDTVAPTLVLNSPVTGAITRVMTVSGAATDTQPVVVTVNGIEMSVASGGAFEGTFDLPEGTWNVRVAAVDDAGNKTEISRSVTVDTTPPEIGELSPVDGSQVNSPATVSGLVTDASPTTIKVNGGDASVNATGHFDASGVVIAEGINQISISAKDAAGNESVAAFSLVGRDHTPPAAPTLFAVMTPTRLAFQTIEGKAEPGALMTITGGAEPVESSAAFGNGHFAANVNLRAGINTLSVVATDPEGNTSLPAQVSITSDPNAAPPPAGQPAQINVSTGNTQKGLVNTELPRPLIAIVTDSMGAPVAGVTLKFTVKEGGGHFVGGSGTFETQTDTHGYASARYISGPTAGLQQISSDFTGNMITPAVFLAESFAAETGAETLVSGMVLDQNLRALPNVLVRLGGQQTRTRADGIFVLRNVASGPHQLLELIGRDQIPLPGRWPNITYDMDVLPGTDNELGRPLFLPRVNEGVAMPLSEQGILTQDVVVELPVMGGEPPVTVTARAGTHVTFPPDATDKRLSVTRIAADRVPMALEDGRATNLYISVQPSGALFEPALEVSFPNLDRQPADSEVLLMSFDHDAGRYVKVGTAHVTPDGRSVKSDPGTGIRVGAWHATPPPPPKPQVTVIGHIKLDGNPAFDNKVVTRLDAWVDGVAAVLNPSLSTAPGSLQAIVTLTMPDGAPRRTFVQSTAQAAQLTVSPTEIFVAVGGEKEVRATVSPAPATPGTFTWQSEDASRVTVAPATGNTNPNVVKIKGVKQGKTKVTVTFVDPTNPKAKLKGEVKVNVGSVIYKEAKAKQCMGFDDTQKDASGNPLPWVVVGVGKTNTAAVADIEPDDAATHVTFASSAGMATVAPATATRDNQPLTVTGVAPGVTDIQSQFDNTNAEKLNVSVKSRLPLRVTFNYVSDNAGHHTGRSHAEAQMVLNRMNEIYGPQTNVEFVMGQVRNIQVQQNLGDKIDILPCLTAGAPNCSVNSPEYQAIKLLGDTTADRNIFFVWRQEYNPSARNLDVDGIAENPGTNLFIEDSLGGEIGQIAAHESGHNFGLGHYTNLIELRYLMYHTTDGGCFIPKREADTINP